MRRVWRERSTKRDLLNGFIYWVASKVCESIPGHARRRADCSVQNSVIDSEWKFSVEFLKEVTAPTQEVGGSISLYACSLDDGPDTVESPGMH